MIMHPRPIMIFTLVALFFISLGYIVNMLAVLWSIPCGPCELNDPSICYCTTFDATGSCSSGTRINTDIADSAQKFLMVLGAIAVLGILAVIMAKKPELRRKPEPLFPHDVKRTRVKKRPAGRRKR